MKPRLLDLFCGAGGAATGYHRAGFEVIGVDIHPQPRYPFEFHQADAISVLRGMLDYPSFNGEMWRPGYFDAVHASPPCHDHTELRFRMGGHCKPHGTGWMLATTIERLSEIALPFVVENVPAADMAGAFTLCARSLGMDTRLRRHRKFVTSFPVLVPPCACRRGMTTVGVYGDLSRNDRSMGRNPDGYPRLRAGVDTARELLGCPWMTAAELSQAIPPVYTQFVGEQLLAHLDSAAAAVQPGTTATHRTATADSTHAARYRVRRAAWAKHPAPDAP